MLSSIFVFLLVSCITVLDATENVCTSLVLGEHVACALHENGTVWCSGHNNFGQKGTGDTKTDDITFTNTTQVVGLTNVKSMHADIKGRTFIAIRSNGSIVGWGSDSYLQLRNISNGGYFVLTPTEIGSYTDVVDVKMSFHSTCILNTNGDVYCWGYRSYGIIGDGSEGVADPAYTAIPHHVTTGVQKIVAGTTTFCALTITNTVRCWGRNLRGEAGPNHANELNVATDIPNWGSSVEDISMSHEHMCAIYTSKVVKCSGINTRAELGNSGSNSQSPRDTNLYSGPTPDKIFASTQATAILDVNGYLHFIGKNAKGQFGSGTISSSRPTSFYRNPFMSNVATLVSFGFETFGLLRDDGSVYVAGANFGGQLNYGNSDNVQSYTLIDESICSTFSTPPPTLSPTRAPSQTPTLAPSNAPTHFGYCQNSSSGHCDETTEMCDTTNTCIAKPACIEHVDCVPYMQEGRLAHCDAGVCEDKYEGTCSTTLACAARLHLDKQKTSGIGTGTLTFNGTAADTATVIASAVSKIQTNISGDARLMLAVAGNETATVPINLYESDPQFPAKFLRARCGDASELCQVRIVAFNDAENRRRLASESVIVEIVYLLDDAAYTSIENNNFEDTAFLDALAAELGDGVTREDVNVLTDTSGVLTIQVTLTEEGDGVTPIGEEIIDDIHAIQNNLGDIATELVDQLSLDPQDIESSQVDLCGERTCNGRGECDPNTGVCACNTEAYWGINCETSVSCTNGGEVFGAYCKCGFPWYGRRCENEKDCLCA